MERKNFNRKLETALIRIGFVPLSYMNISRTDHYISDSDCLVCLETVKRYRESFHRDITSVYFPTEHLRDTIRP